MTDSPLLPGQHSWKDAGGRPLPVEWFRFLRDLAGYIKTTQGVTVDLAALQAQIDALEGVTLTGPMSVLVSGGDGTYSLRLVNDQATPGALHYYGTNATGAKGWHALAMTALADVELTGLTDGDALSWNATSLVWEPVAPGMTNPMTTAGDLIYGGVSGVPTRLAAGPDTHILTMVAGAPAWAAPSAGSGTVTSVGFSFDATLSDIFGASGTPVTTSGTITAAGVDAGSDMLLFWDDSAGKLTYLTLGSNLSITGTTLNATGGSGSPGGSNTQVQFNSSGSFGADSTFTFNATTKALSCPLMWYGKGADIARAATTSIANATGNFVHLTGTTTITSFGSGTAGQTVYIRFAGAGTLTHNATSLILPGAANITTAANDCCVAVSEGGSNWRVTSYTRANGQALVAGAATVANWTTAISTASPNGTVPVASWTATNAATNVDAAFVAKGNGASLAQVPNSATSGGDKRGIYATDWQKARGGSFQVASGNYSTIGGGSDNTAQGAYGTVAGGYGNNANQQYATVAGGNVNSAGDHGFVGGGGGNSCVSGAYGAIAGGAENTVDEAYGWIPGGYQATTRGQKGAGARAGGKFSGLGDCQSRSLILRAQTFNATQTELTLDGAAATFNNLLRLPDNSCFMVRGHIQARESATGDSRQWEFVALIRRGSGAGTTAMNVTCTPTSLYNAAGASAWAIAVDADTTNGSLRFRGTGQAAKTIRWQADIYACTELVG